MSARDCVSVQGLPPQLPSPPWMSDVLKTWARMDRNSSHSAIVTHEVFPPWSQVRIHSRLDEATWHAGKWRRTLLQDYARALRYIRDRWKRIRGYRRKSSIRPARICRKTGKKEVRKPDIDSSRR